MALLKGGSRPTAPAPGGQSHASRGACPERSRMGLVSWAGQTRRSVLIPSARGTYSFPLALGDEGQWKGMSLTKDPSLMRDNRPPGRMPGPGNEGMINRDAKTGEGKTNA
jgi:hypothetical protein